MPEMGGLTLFTAVRVEPALLNAWERSSAAADATFAPYLRELSHQIRPLVDAVSARAAALLQAPQHAS